MKRALWLGLLLVIIVAIALAFGFVALPMLGSYQHSASPAQYEGCSLGRLNYTVSQDLSLDSLFDSYGDSGSGGWTGGDGTYSASLPNGTEVWMFSDTFLGEVVNNTRPQLPYVPLIHNSFVVERNGRILRTVYNDSGGIQRALVSPSGSGSWYWIGSGVVNGGTLQVIAPEFVQTGTGIFGFRQTGTSLAVLSAQNLSVESITPLGYGRNISWAAWAMVDGNYTYVYGTYNDSAYVARVRGTDLLGQWQYFNGSGWTLNPNDSAPVLESIETAFSVTRFRSGYLLIGMDPYLDGRIYAYSSCSPTGPFVNKTEVYATPEQAEYANRSGYEIFTYGAIAHPELSSNSSIVVSYNVNGGGPNATTDATVYRPRFLYLNIS